MSSQCKMSDDGQFSLKQVIIDVSRFIIRPWIKSVEYNFDNYWRELELSFIVSSDVDDRELIELRNELLSFFNSNYPDNEISFDWQAVFKRANKIMEVLIPEDNLRDVNDRLVDLSI